MQFVSVQPEDIEKLRPALIILEEVSHASYSQFPDYSIYGFTTNPALVEHAQATVQGFYEDDDEAPTPSKLVSIAIAIPVKTDILWYLTGSGLKADSQEFAYTSGENTAEGVRTLNFRQNSGHSTPEMTLSDFTELAIADGDTYLDEFYKQFSDKVVPEAQEVPDVKRTEDATDLQTPQEPKLSSLRSLVEGFLG